MHPLLNIAVNAARSSSKIILRSIDRMHQFSVSEKTKNDFVTEVDKLTELEIIGVIRKAHPDHRILGEETGSTSGNADSLWIIDPLDGTANFIHNIPHYAVSIAFQYKGKIEQAVIYDPIRDELFTASRGEGAKLNDRRIRVSECVKLENSIIGTGFPFRNRDMFLTYLQSFQAIYPQVSDLRRAGSAALDLAYVASGRLDGHWELGLKSWDIAAGVLLIKEAGGFVSDFSGQENYLDSGNIVAGNQKIFKELLRIVQPIFKEVFSA
jgi:myo-inositol-1(or 4)-monophosphatase